MRILDKREALLWCRTNGLTEPQMRRAVAETAAERRWRFANRRAIVAAQRAIDRRLAAYQGENR